MPLHYCMRMRATFFYGIYRSMRFKRYRVILQQRLSAKKAARDWGGQDDAELEPTLMQRLSAQKAAREREEKDAADLEATVSVMEAHRLVFSACEEAALSDAPHAPNCLLCPSPCLPTWEDVGNGLGAKSPAGSGGIEYFFHDKPAAVAEHDANCDAYVFFSMAYQGPCCDALHEYELFQAKARRTAKLLGGGDGSGSLATTEDAVLQKSIEELQNVSGTRGWGGPGGWEDQEGGRGTQIKFQINAW